MTRHLLLGAAVSALMLSGAFAQTTPTSPAPSSPPAAAQDDQSKPAASDTQSAGDQAKNGKPEMVAEQKPDQFLASKFEGTDVVGDDDKKIGDVSDVLFDKDGKIQAYVISIGGFLGVGAKEIALAPSSFEVVAGDKSKNESDKLKLSMNKDELKTAQDFKPYQPPRATTTGTGGGGTGGSPLGGGGGAPGGGGMSR
jgi:hypothetical protein